MVKTIEKRMQEKTIIDWNGQPLAINGKWMEELVELRKLDDRQWKLCLVLSSEPCTILHEAGEDMVLKLEVGGKPLQR